MSKSYFNVEVPPPKINGISVYELQKFDIFYIDNYSIYFLSKLTLPVNDSDEIFEMNLWVRTMQAEYEKKIKTQLSSNLLELNSEIFGFIPFYKLSSAIECVVEFELDNRTELPNIKLIEGTSAIHNDYATGIAKKKFLSWMSILENGDLIQNLYEL